MRAVSRSLFFVEAALLGLFFVQSLRYLIGSLYALLSSATIYAAIDLNQVDPQVPGLVSPATASAELTLLVYMLALPLLAVVFGRVRQLMAVAGIAVALGRLAAFGAGIHPVSAATLTIGMSLFYIVLSIRHRAEMFPYLFVLGFGLDQVFRAFGNTLDPTWQPGFAIAQLILSLLLAVLVLRNYAVSGHGTPHLMPPVSGLAMGAMLFLQLALLALPNAIASRANTDYTLFVPFVLAATLLPVMPWVRRRAHGFITLFDHSVRGWVWMLIIALLLVFGMRFGQSGLANLFADVEGSAGEVLRQVFGARTQAAMAGGALVIAQLCISLLWWWLIRPQAERERNLSGLWLIGGVLMLLMFVLFDLFTYEYAYVRDMAPQLAFLNDIIPPLLRGFRGLGLAVLLLAVFVAALPMLQMNLRVPWTGGTLSHSLAGLVLVVAGCLTAAYFARPPVVQAVRNADTLRIATYNIHAGYNEFFRYSLEDIAYTISFSGAQIVLLQEVETGRLTSFGVDQALWLARELGMDVRFFPTNEGLQGLAVLSKVEIVFDEGALLSSLGQQTGVQRLQVRPDDGIITVYNTWLGLLWEGGSATIPEQEQEQFQQLLEILTRIRLDHPDGILGRTVIGGTFNHVPDSDLIRRIASEGFIDPLAERAAARSMTFVQTMRRARLDYLWIRNLTHLSGDVLPNAGSDHRLAVIEVSLTR